ncbi:MAG TPA: hypothetical protein VFX76_15760, partial [Roseiflexaceae bacterium]|nr:hypothetical protein [Roseiflexaceae bacterium]
MSVAKQEGMMSARKADGSKPPRAPKGRAKAGKSADKARAGKHSLSKSKTPNRKFTAKQAAAVASGTEDLPTAKKVWAAMKSGALAKGALGLAQACWVNRQARAMQDAKALLADRKRTKPKLGERKFLRQVIGRMAKPARDMTERPLY